MSQNEEAKSYLEHLNEGVPFHELAERDVSSMSHLELTEFIKTTRARRVAPSDRKKMKSSAVKEITATKKNKPSVSATLDGIL